MAEFIKRFLILFCIALEAIHSISSNVSGAELGSALNNVILNCTHKLDFKSISEFDKFFEDYRSVIEDEKPIPDSNKHLDKCVAEKDAVYALHNLVANYDRKRACKFSQIGKLEGFAREYIKKNRRSVTLKFFTLFSVNVAVICKINLLAHLKQADLEADQLDFIYSMASPVGWNVLINEYTKKSMKFGSSSHAGSNLINRIAKLIPGLVQVDQLDYMSFDHTLNEKTVDVESGSYTVENPILGRKIAESIEQVIESCKNLDKFYVNSVLSLSRLVELGINIDLLNEQHEYSHRLHKWLAATSFCQLMVRVEVKLVDSSIDFKIIHDDKLLVDRRKLYSYVSEFNEISEEAKLAVWQVSIPEGKWCQKNQSMFRQGQEISVAKSSVQQFIKGLERDFSKSEEL